MCEKYFSRKCLIYIFLSLSEIQSLFKMSASFCTETKLFLVLLEFLTF